MEISKDEKIKSCPTTLISLLHGDEIFFNKLLSKDSSIGLSSRHYFRAPAGVPFKWESEPGTPINNNVCITNDLLPPLSLPPGATHGATPDRSFSHTDRSKGSGWFKTIWYFWKKNNNKSSSNKRRLQRCTKVNRVWEMTGSGRVQSLEFWISDADSSRSSSVSSADDYSPNSASRSGKREAGSGFRVRVGRPDLVGRCSPWNLSIVVTRISKV